MKTNIAFVLDFPFPYGIAATNRVLSYSKVLAKNNFDIKVYITRPTEKKKAVLNNYRKGFIGKIRYEYCSWTTIRPSNRLYKRFLLILGYFLLIIKLFKDNPKVIITYTGNYYLKRILLILRPLISYKLIVEETEYPKILSSSKSKYYKKRYLIQYSKADGMIIMTRELINYYKSIGVKYIFHLPMTVDIERFNKVKENNVRKPYFIYIGGGGGFERDGLIDIVKGFYQSNIDGHSCNLVIVGSLEKSNSLSSKIHSFITNHSLENRIHFLGDQPPYNVPSLLINSIGIIMAPPKNFPSGGFPTKLGEFLASGRPVICTNVSEIADYLTLENSFLVHPKDTKAIGQQINYILKNPEFSSIIGKSGRKLANTVFNVDTYILDLIKFLKLG